MDGKRECVLCDRVWAVFGLLVGVVFLYMSVDILTGSKLSSLIDGKKDDTDE